MITALVQFVRLQGTTGRFAYLAWGTGLMALKYNLDRLVAQRLGGVNWTWMSYWQPKSSGGQAGFSSAAALYAALVALALPFVFAGIALTLRRLRDAGWPLWLTALFFLPGVNLVLFLCLSLAPSRAAGPVPSPGRRYSWLAFSSPRASALAGLALTVLLSVPAIGFGAAVLGSYGWGVFVGLPFLMGMLAALIHTAAGPRSLGSCCVVALLAVLFAGVALLCFAIEGLFCVLMAAPLALSLAVLGAVVGYVIQSTRWNRAHTGTVYTAAWLVLPVLLYGESRLAPTPSMIAVSTRVDIAASPATVWRSVVTFSTIPPPTELIFRAGIAYPTRARIFGHGVGAVRHCEFSTGPFVEPITVWDEPRELAFDVTRQPHPMQELSPYRDLTPPHLEGFFQSRHGRFLLTRLPDGRTQLEGTTYYEQRLWPNGYWRLWSDYLVHRIHRRVLEHIKTEAEAASS